MEIEKTGSIDPKSGYSLLHGNEMEEKEIGHRLITNIETMGDIDTIRSIQVFERSEQEWIDTRNKMKYISMDERRSGYVRPSSGWRDYILNSTRTTTSIGRIVGMDGIDSLDDSKTEEGERTCSSRMRWYILEYRMHEMCMMVDRSDMMPQRPLLLSSSLLLLSSKESIPSIPTILSMIVLVLVEFRI